MTMPWSLHHGGDAMEVMVVQTLCRLFAQIDGDQLISGGDGRGRRYTK